MLADVTIDDIVEWLHGQDCPQSRSLLEAKSLGQHGKVEEAWVWLALGDYYYHRDLYDRAKVSYIRARDHRGNSGEARARALVGIGNALTMESDVFDARDAYLSALEEAEASHLGSVAAETLTYLSGTERMLGEYSASEEHARQSLLLNIKLQRKVGMKGAVQNLIDLALLLDVARTPESAELLLVWCEAQLQEAQNYEAELALIRAARASTGTNEVSGSDQDPEG